MAWTYSKSSFSETAGAGVCSVCAVKTFAVKVSLFRSAFFPALMDSKNAVQYLLVQVSRATHLKCLSSDGTKRGPGSLQGDCRGLIVWAR